MNPPLPNKKLQKKVLLEQRELRTYKELHRPKYFKGNTYSKQRAAKLGTKKQESLETERNN